MRKRILYGLVIAACLLLAVPITASATGELVVTGGVLDTDYTYTEGLLTVLTNEPLTISGSTVTDSVYVASGVNANITLSDVSIQLEEDDACAFEIAAGSTGDVSITLAGTNLLQSGGNRAGLQKSGADAGVGTLTIDGEGSLTATGGSDGAGIGGGKSGGGGSSQIIISGGNITATGGSGAAGIGTSYGGNYGSNHNITIFGGNVIATGGGYAAGIGGGYTADGNHNIDISGDAVVFAKRGALGTPRDIGSGSSGSSGGTFAISGWAAVFMYNGSGPDGENVTCEDGHALTDSFSYSSSFCGISLPTEWSDATSFKAYLRLVTLDYDANGGDGTAPSSQQQHIGTTGTIQAGSGLSSDGYSFDGWITEGDDGYIFYNPGDSFTFNANTTLYAQWAEMPLLYIGSDNVADTDGDVHYWRLSDDSVTEMGASDDYDFSVRYIDEGADPKFILTLNGLNLTSYLIFDDASKIGVYSNIPLSIVLTEGSENSITLYGEADYYNFGVYAAGDLAVTGSGSLDVTVTGGGEAESSWLYGFDADNINISGGEITVRTLNALLEATALRATRNVVITDGEITCEATSSGYAAGIHAGDDKSEEGGVSISGGTVATEVTGGTTSVGIMGYNSVDISGGSVSSIAAMPEPSDGDFGAIAICVEMGNLTITGGEITASAEGGGDFTFGLLSFNDSVSISGGTVTASARNAAKAGGIGSIENITINGGVVNAAAISDGTGPASGLIAVNVYFGEGSVTASASVDEENHLSIAVAINVREDGDVTIYAEDYRYRTESTGDYSYSTDTPYVHSSNPYTEIATLYSVGYDYNYGELGSFETMFEAYGSNPTAPDSPPLREYYNFDGWYKTPACEAENAVDFTTYTITDDVILYAGWVPTEYEISYNLAGGAISGNPASYNIESSSITLNNPTRSGYNFAGWTGTGLSVATMSVTVEAGSTGNREYTATWTQIPIDNGDDTGGGIPPTTTTPPATTTETPTGTLTVNSDASGKAEVKADDLNVVETLLVKAEVTLSFDKSATDAIKASERDVTIAVTKVETSTLTEEAQKVVGDRPVYEFTVTAGVDTLSDFGGGSVTISVPYTPKADEDVNALVVYYIDNSGALIPAMGAYNPATGTIDFMTTHFSKYAVGYNYILFSDVAETAWYKSAVTFIAARGITSGTGDGTTYSPEAKLTRGEFIVLMMRAYGISPDTNPTENFSDAGDTYYTGYLAAAKRLGISAGVGDNKYAPAAQITRQEMFTLLYNALKLMGQFPTGDSGKTVADFIDNGQIASWAQEAMTLLVKTGTVGGNNGELTPTDTTTRAEMAQVLYNLLRK